MAAPPPRSPFSRVADIGLTPFVVPAAILLKLIRAFGVRKLPLCKKTLLGVGVFPIRKHYYEPLFDMRGLRVPLDEERQLPGIDWNLAEQLQLVATFSHDDEVEQLREFELSGVSFAIENPSFSAGDAEYLYQLVRHFQPRRVLEIGCGRSTLVIERALMANQARGTPRADHLCVEPYEASWLEQLGVEVIRTPVETMEPARFEELQAGDLLFIDSSHVIRPQGDVLFEVLEILPRLRSGVVVHFHDIFSPRDYPRLWVEEDVRFWNEQYLLEAFLSHNQQWKVIGALNLLHHRHFAALSARCPFLTKKHEPGSLYIQRC